MSSPRLLMIGWDAADRDTIDAWIAEEGALPTLAALRARGHWGRVAELPGLGDDAAWGSFAIGTEPGEHGRFHHRQIVPGTDRVDNFSRGQMRGDAFWSRASAAGRRVAVLDVPKSPLGVGLNGKQLADWLPHGEDGPVPVSSPPELAAALPPRFRVRPDVSCHEPRTTVAELATLRDRIRAHVDLRTDLALTWLREEPWDLSLTVFAESHCIGHHCWHLHDPAHPAHDRQAASILGDPVRQIYQSLDRALARLLTLCGPDTTVIVFSLIGMGTTFLGSPALVDEVVRRLDARWRGPEPPLRAPGLFARLRAGLKPTAGPSPDLRARNAFAVHTNSVASAIRVNLLGREPHGRIRPEACEDYCRFLTASFEALVDPASGRPVVTEVVRVADRYPGPNAAAFADVLVVWNGAAPITAVASDAIGVVDGGTSTDPTGNHRPGGWFVAAGPSIAPGEPAQPMAIVDFAPAVGALLGVDLSRAR